MKINKEVLEEVKKLSNKITLEGELAPPTNTIDLMNAIKANTTAISIHTKNIHIDVLKTIFCAIISRNNFTHLIFENAPSSDLTVYNLLSKLKYLTRITLNNNSDVVVSSIMKGIKSATGMTNLDCTATNARSVISELANTSIRELSIDELTEDLIPLLEAGLTSNNTLKSIQIREKISSNTLKLFSESSLTTTKAIRLDTSTATIETSPPRSEVVVPKNPTPEEIKPTAEISTSNKKNKSPSTPQNESSKKFKRLKKTSEDKVKETSKHPHVNLGDDEDDQPLVNLLTTKKKSLPAQTTPHSFSFFSELHSTMNGTSQIPFDTRSQLLVKYATLLAENSCLKESNLECDRQLVYLSTNIGKIKSKSTFEVSHTETSQKQPEDTNKVATRHQFNDTHLSDSTQNALGASKKLSIEELKQKIARAEDENKKLTQLNLEGKEKIRKTYLEFGNYVAQVPSLMFKAQHQENNGDGRQSKNTISFISSDPDAATMNMIIKK